MAIILLPAMWVYHLVFIHFRTEMNKSGRALNKDLEWLFGQVLAAATWMPVVVELVYLYHQGAARGMTSQMTAPFRAIIADEGVLVLPDVVTSEKQAYQAVKGVESPFMYDSVSV
jgi:hypothetical protein